MLRILDKAVTEEEGPNVCLGCSPKMMSKSQLPAVKKDIIFGEHPQQIFGPFLFR